MTYSSKLKVDAVLYTPEKSDKTKTNNFVFVFSSMLTSCIIVSRHSIDSMLAMRRVTRLELIVCLCHVFNVDIMHPCLPTFDQLNVSRWRCNSFEEIYSFLALSQTSWIPNPNSSNQSKRVGVNLARGRRFHEGM